MGPIGKQVEAVPGTGQPDIGDPISYDLVVSAPNPKLQKPSDSSLGTADELQTKVSLLYSMYMPITACFPHAFGLKHLA